MTFFASKYFAGWSVSECETEKYFLCETEIDHDNAEQLDHGELFFGSDAGFVEIKAKLIDHDNVHTNEINLRVSTFDKDALLFWQGEETENPQIFIAILILDGYVTINAANEQFSVFGVKVNDGEHHSIQVFKSPSNLTLIVDDNFQAHMKV